MTSPRPPSRPNRYSGPLSTWRSWTASERELAASLGQLQARDLSLHLYNANRLKKRAINQQQISKGNAEQDELEERHALEKIWLPPKVWTAWPMAQDQVPREGEGMSWEEEGNETSSLYRKRFENLSHSMEELLAAQCIKESKERYLARKWETEKSDLNELYKENNRKRSRSLTKASDSGHEDGKESQLEPVVLADDDRARDILQPTIRNILSRLDDLLMGLHHARRSYMSKSNDSASETQTDVAENANGISRRRRVNTRRKGAKSQPITGQSVKAPSSESGNWSSSSNESRQPAVKKRRKGTSPFSRSRSLHNRQIRVGLRDWADVLGVSSMIGWDQTIINRTAARCASLFKEGMTFRILEEGKDENKEVSYLPSVSKGSLSVS